MNQFMTSLIVFLILCYPLKATDKNASQDQQLNKPLIESASNFDGNRIDCDIENNGMFVSHRISGRSGMQWPKGYNVGTIYASGVFLGGKINDEIRVTAGEYAGEYASGPWGADHSGQYHKIYKVNKSDLANPLSNQDFQNWPVDLGAPWIDNNENGKYEPLPNGPDHPEFIGNQVLWMVMNDGIDSLHTVFHSPPLGVEVQRTIFGLERTDAFGDIMFVKDLIINKGGNTIEEMYIGLWCDPDLGDAADDLVGTDTTLGMGICYNDGDDAVFTNPHFGGTALGMTPAVGYDFFQGPRVPAPGETANMFGREIPDMKNLKMTSFIKYIGSDPVYYDPNNAEEAYFYMTGFLPDGSDFPFIATGGSKFLHPGDPTKDTGPDDNEFIDKDLHQSDDRRFLMSSGPLTMAPSDSQEIVFGIINAADGSALDSYLRLKEVDKIAQAYYDANFQNSEEPTPPIIEITSLDDQILLKWDDSSESYISEDVIDLDPDTEDPTYYKFEGYNVYQLENIYGTGKVKRIATFDKINGIKRILDDVYVPEYGKYINIYVQHGNDSGLSREIQISKDALNNDSPLLVNREYYFAVTAYGFNEYGIPKTLESIKEIVAVRPQTPATWISNNDTVDYNYSFDAEHTKGIGDGFVYLTVIDKTQITGDSYKVTFNDYLMDGSDTLDITNWNLINISNGETVLENQTTISDFNTIYGYHSESPIADGIRINVLGPKPDIKWIVVTANANGPIVEGVVDGLPYWRYPDWLSWNSGNYENQQSNGATWMLNTHPGYGPGGPETFYNSVTFASGGQTIPPTDGLGGLQSLVPFDFECRFTGEGKAYDYWNGTGVHSVPFEWWNIGSGTPDSDVDDYKLISYYLDDNNDGMWGLVPVDHETSGGNNDPYTDRIYVMAPTNDSPGTEGHDNFFNNVMTDGSNVAHWTSRPGDNDPGGPMDTWNVFSRLVFMNWNGGDPDDPTFPQNINALEPEIGTVFRIATTKPNTSDDEFEFSTATFAGSTIKYRPKNINVWPNPYFGYNPEENSVSDRQIHFTNLPTEGKCIIRIFDLSGILVRKLDHNDGTQFEIWDVRDYKSKPVASGMFIVHIETESGDKILKMAVVQSQ